MPALVCLLLLSACADTADASFLLCFEGTLPEETPGGEFLLSVTIPSHPRPISYGRAQTALGNLRGTIESSGSRSRVFPLNLFFFTADASGGFDAELGDSSGRSITLEVTGDPLFSGSSSRPQFAAGEYQVTGAALVGSDPFTILGNPRLTITEQSTPEGNTGALLLAGLLVAGWARHRGRGTTLARQAGPLVAPATGPGTQR